MMLLSEQSKTQEHRMNWPAPRTHSLAVRHRMKFCPGCNRPYRSRGRWVGSWAYSDQRKTWPLTGLEHPRVHERMKSSKLLHTDPGVVDIGREIHLFVDRVWSQADRSTFAWSRSFHMTSYGIKVCHLPCSYRIGKVDGNFICLKAND